MPGECSRREMLRSSAVIAAVAACSGPARASESGRQRTRREPLRLGLMTYNLARNWDIDTIIRNCTETGFEHVELRTTHAHGVEVTLSKSRRQEVRKRFEDAGIKLSLASAFSYHHPDAAELRRHIEGTKEYTILAHDLGALGIRVFPNALLADKGIPEEQTIRQIGKAAGEVANFAHDYGVQIRLAVHGRGTNIVGKVKQMVDCSNSPYLAINWNCDLNDTKGPGLDANFDSVKDRIGNIHMHELSDEKYPYRRFFRLLRQSKYQGYCDAEIPESAEPIRLMKYYRALFLALQDAI
jgi:sugar phosphate isomerase/epimerase